MTAMSLGQHFLVNQGLAEKIVKALSPLKGPILEIGPGKGILSEQLIKYHQRNKIILVELDSRLVSKLRVCFSDSLQIINHDILKLDLNRVFPDCHEGVNLISNVPYYLSKDLVDWLLGQRKMITKGIFMMQKEFVDKLLVKGKSRLAAAQTVLFNGIYKGEKICDVQPGSFAPPPKVKSTVFLFERRIVDFEKDIDEFYTFLKVCFFKRRKTLLNNLAALYADKKLENAFKKSNIPPKARAEELNLENFLRIFYALR